MWLAGGVGVGAGEQKIPDFEAEERLGEVLTNSLIILISETRKGPGLQTLARIQESQLPAAPSHRTLLSFGTRMFSEQFF